jgi:hypothetical protein
MYVVTVPDGTVAQLEQKLAGAAAKRPTWMLMYAVQDAPLAEMMGLVRKTYPSVPVFGATSYKGVFTPNGFERGAAFLAGEANDETAMAVSLWETGAALAADRARRACQDIERELGRRPDMLLLHATPGFEERLLEGIASVFGGDLPVYGGSAADDEIAGRWRVFANGIVHKEGFVLAGIAAPSPPSGGFLGGYIPTQHTGTVTRVEGRVIQEIDGRPAAVVYNEWTGGLIEEEIDGGNVLFKTNLRPIGRSIGMSMAMPSRLLSHPHEVVAPDQSLAFFTEFAVGDQLTLMMSTRDPLVTRVRRAAQRARGSRVRKHRAGLLVYCGGCLGILLDQASRISAEFRSELGDAPFIGIATFGEQGSFFDKGASRHGNLMCSALLF